MNNDTDWQQLAELTISSMPGNERIAMEQVAKVAETLHLPERRLEQLKTAVAEATMNAMEHGNHYNPELSVTIKVLASPTTLSVRITDHGAARIPSPDAGNDIPDIEAKLAELQTPRGWGLFLIKHMVDEMNISSDSSHHTIELIMYLKGEENASKKS